MHLELGGMQRLCHNLFTSWLLESLFCMHFSLYILFSRNHSWLICQIPSLQTAAGAHAEECGARGEVRTQERDSRGAAGHHLHDKMLLRSVDLIMIPGYHPSPLIRCWMSEQAEVVSVWWIVWHVLCQVRHVMMSDVTMSRWNVQAGEGVSWAPWSWQWPGSPHGEKLPGEWQWCNVPNPDLDDHLDPSSRIAPCTPVTGDTAWSGWRRWRCVDGQSQSSSCYTGCVSDQRPVVRCHAQVCQSPRWDDDT